MKLKIGVLGAGHLGKIHIRCILQTNQYELIGFYDPNETNAEAAINQFGAKRYNDLTDLIANVDVVDIVTPTPLHYNLARQAALAGKHIFIEKPLTETVEEAAQLMSLCEQMNVKVQVGHVERFNPAVLAMGDTPMQPMFIEAHRLATFNPRGTDVSVILDLMIHDIDLILSMVSSAVRQINASGVAVVSDTPDICNARIQFENGCVANLTASRISMKQMRKIRLFQPDAYISLDLLDKNAQIIRLYDKDNAPDNENLMELETAKGTKYIEMAMPESVPVNAIQMELESFAESIIHEKPIKVSINDGYRALKVAHDIIKCLNV